ncbi:MAG: hypothetical protein H6924_01265 [Alphaproteobacteria bacterium]|nr:hypothetical protein [Alphaproteobacteria bacterium]
MHVQWRARLEEHLGSFTWELATARAGELMESRAGLADWNAFAAVCSAALPEREAHANVHDAAAILLDAMDGRRSRKTGCRLCALRRGCWMRWASGWTQRRMRATGDTDDLAVSPRSAAPFRRAGAGVCANRLFRLPGSLTATMPPTPMTSPPG